MQAVTAPRFVIRASTEDDLNHVRHTWLRSYCDSDFAKSVAPAYWIGHIRVRDRLLERCPPVVASMPDEPDAICGWACFEPGVLHYVFVKERWRRMGVARLLLAPLELDKTIFTHRTRLVSRLPVPQSWTFNPYLAMMEKP